MASWRASGEAPAEVAGGGGIGDAARAQGIEERVVVAPPFEVLETGAVAERVVRDVEDVVGLVIGQMNFEQVKTFVDGLGQAESVREHVDRPDAAVGNGPVAVGHVVGDEVIGEDGPGGGRVPGLVESASDSGLARAEPGAEHRVHSKSLLRSGRMGGSYLLKPRKPPRISSFWAIAAKEQAEITLG
jgi:hypothetical protein